MKKTSLLKTIMLLSITTFAISFVSCKDEEPPKPVLDQFEPNNTILAASSTTLGADIAGNISEAADEDFYKVTGTASSKIDILRFTLINSSDANYTILIYDKNKVLLAQVPYPGKSANLSYDLQTKESEFYVQVVAKDAGSYPANYTLKASFANAADEFEENDIIGTPALFPLETVENCNLLLNDVDYYTIQDLSSTNIWDQYDVKLVNLTADMNPSMSLYDESKAIINSLTTTDAGAGQDITKTILMRSGASNSRYVKVSTTSAFTTVPAGYTLQIVKKNVNEASEPNDAYSTARVIDVNGTYTGTIMVNKTATNPDVDYIKITVPPTMGVTRLVPSLSNVGIEYEAFYSFNATAAPTSMGTFSPNSTSYTVTNSSTTSNMYIYIAIKATADISTYSFTITIQ